MKITKVEAMEVRLPEDEIRDWSAGAQNACIIKVYTDEGIVGVGEVESSAHVAKAVIDAPMAAQHASGLGQLIIGMNPLDYEVIYDKLYMHSFYYGRRAVVVHAISGIDIALWDIAGKFYRQPVYQLLGGAFHKKLRTYASETFGESGRKTEELGKKWTSEGFTAVKFGWTPMGQNEKLDLELVEGARRGVGDKNDFMIDAGCCWDTRTAKTRAWQFEPYRPVWLEEPLQADNLEGYAELRRSSNIPIAAGEGEAGIYAWKQLFDNGCIDIAQVDVARNGFTGSKRVADLAEMHGLKVVNHFWSTPVNLAAGLHWLASRKSTFVFEYCVDYTPIRLKLAKNPPTSIDGFVSVPEEPGLGIELDEEVLAKYRVS